MDIATFHFIDTLKARVPALERENGELRARVEELEAELARRKGGRPRKVDEVLAQGEAN